MSAPPPPPSGNPVSAPDKPTADYIGLHDFSVINRQSGGSATVELLFLYRLPIKDSCARYKTVVVDSTQTTQLPFGTPRNCTSCLVHLLSAIARRPPYWNYLCHMICGGQNGGRQHAGPFGSPRNIRLTSEVSVPCTYQSFGSPRKFPFRARGTK